ncbi:hypothetical protein GW17_00050963 [Ensete ventricosum]|nr:hypothetical protein GW17_00050963 [Ensete ventricosum]
MRLLQGARGSLMRCCRSRPRDMELNLEDKTDLKKAKAQSLASTTSSLDPTMGSDEEVDDLMGVVAAVTVITEEDDVGSGEGIKVDDSLKVELEGTQLGCCKGRRGGIVVGIGK